MRFWAAVFVAAMLLPCLAMADPLPVSEVAPGIYAFKGAVADMDEANHGDIANLAFVVGHAAVAVIDTGGSLDEGKRFKAAISQITKLPIRYVIYTHVHPDHIFGAAAFVGSGVTFVGHQRLPDEFAARGPYYVKALDRMIGADAAAGSTIVEPKLQVGTGSEISLDLGGRMLTVHAHDTAHTDTDLSIYDKQSQTLFAGDLLFVDRIPSLDGSVTGWLKELDYLKHIPAARVVPGHGPVSMPWPQAAGPEIRYLTSLETQVGAAIKQGVGIAKASTTLLQEERKNWLLFDDYNAHNITVAYKAMEWE
jgi:quinoprotein relay system zinc metallohydrolase 2